MNNTWVRHQKSAIKPNTRDPSWDEYFYFPITPTTDRFAVQVWDRDSLPPDPFGDDWVCYKFKFFNLLIINSSHI